MTAGAPLPPSPLEIGLKALEEGRMGDALHAFEQAYHINPHDHRLHEACGALYLAQGDLKRAREYLEYATHLAPDAPGPRYRLALVLLQQGRAADAVQNLRRVLILDPNHEAARQALTAEEERWRIAARLPTWLAARSLGPEIILRPPRQIGPDGKDRPAPVRAPHHCVNCFFRPGQMSERLYAYRYQWWNLGLVGLVFGGWPVYLLWTVVTRDRLFALDPLYCPVCSSHRRVLSAIFWVLLSLGAVFGVSGFTGLAVWQSQPTSEGLLIFWVVMLVLALGCAGAGIASYRAGQTQRGLRVRALSAEEVAFSFASRQYAVAFRDLNHAFVVDRPRPHMRGRTESFVPEAPAEPVEAAPPPPSDRPAADPPAPSP
jgi:Tetratricopeptide repeat